MKIVNFSFNRAGNPTWRIELPEQDPLKQMMVYETTTYCTYLHHAGKYKAVPEVVPMNEQDPASTINKFLRLHECPTRNKYWRRRQAWVNYAPNTR